jgi:SAM-dependent methyltransferase
MDIDKYIWHIASREDRSKLEAAYIHGLISYVGLETGEKYKTILDVPCGNGRLHPWLEKSGYEVEGFDLSEELVEEARKNGRNCWQGNMADPKAYPDKKYDVILNWFTSFGYLSEEENEKTIRIWADHLKKKGLLIIDTALPRKTNFTGDVRYDNDIVEIMYEEPEGNIRHLDFKFYKDLGDRMELIAENKMDLRLYEPEEMKEVLERNGFEVFKIRERFTFKGLSESSGAATYVALKK